MSVDLTSSGKFVFKPIQATFPTIPDNKFKPNKVMHEWVYAVTGSGDASAGVVSADLDFGAFDSNHYIVITAIFADFGTVNGMILLYTQTDRWDNLYIPGQANITTNLWVATGNYYIAHRDQLSKPLYLGRPRASDGNPGLSTIAWTVNTNGSAYGATIQGYTLARPLPFCSILQP